MEHHHVKGGGSLCSLCSIAPYAAEELIIIPSVQPLSSSLEPSPSAAASSSRASACPVQDTGAAAAAAAAAGTPSKPSHSQRLRIACGSGVVGGTD